MLIKVLVLFLVMLFLLILRFPVFLSLGCAAAAVALFFPGTVPVEVIGQGFISGLNNYSYVAIFCYFLLGEIMNSGGMSERLISFGDACIGHIRGSLSHINIIASVIFAGVSGSAVADTAAIGSLMIPAMKKQGYDGEYAAAVTIASSCIGPIIPPSGGLVLMGIYLSCSINKMFLGGMIPGLLMGVVELIISFYISEKRKYPRTDWKGWRHVLHSFRQSFFALLLPIIVVYCLVAGVGTVVEIGALAVVFAVIFSAFAYRELNLRQFIKCCCGAAKNAACVAPILACAGVFTWIISSIGVSSALQDLLFSLTSNPTVCMLLCMLVLFLFGMILDVNVIQMVIIPVMVPIVNAFGIDPIHFGVLAMLTTMLGLITPPVGQLIYVSAEIAEVNPMQVVKASIPFIVGLVILVVVLVFCPVLVTGFPNFVTALQGA